MVATYEIPLTPAQQQRFTTTLNGVIYNMFVQWRGATAQCWTMDLSDRDGALLVGGIPLLPGLDLMQQYAELGFPGQLWVQSDSDVAAPPTFANLGVSSHLYFVVL